MASSQSSNPTNAVRPEERDQQIKKLASMIQGIRQAMLTTVDEQGELHSRPMAAQELDFDGNLYFFTSDQSPKCHEIENHQKVNVTFSDPDEQRYVTMSGQAEIIHDRAKMKELWTPFYKAWFPDGLDDSHLSLIKVAVDRAEIWESPSSPVVHLVGLAKALVTGKPYAAGKDQKLDLTG